MLKLIIFLIMAVPAFAETPQKEISISFDDAPREDTSFFTGKKRTHELIKALKDAGVDRAAFYLNPVRMRGPDQIERIKDYVKAGHLLGNHTYEHPDIREVGAKEYVGSIEKADRILMGFEGFKRWFRYTFLGRGKTVEVRDTVYAALDRLGYKDAYVTIDNFDWYMDILFQKAVEKKKNIDFKKLKALYVGTLYDSVKFYDDLAIHVLGRSPKHVILLHENDLNALYVRDLVLFLRAKNWKVVSPEEAYTDPIGLKRPDTLHNGDGRIAALAHEKGYSGQIRDRYQDRKTLDQLFEEARVFTNP